ncbi:hypothetical protein GOV09_03535 [Candidatus Woesearchaeota archaeon]|nr:hypothetical protein [Candidatus Woesearchaeota archaeon]
MAPRLTPEYAEHLLATAPSDKNFHIFNGPMVHCIEELHQALRQISEEQFKHHKNNSKNDFYNWILLVVGDIKLANDIARAKTKQTMLKRIDERISYLKSKVNR